MKDLKNIEFGELFGIISTILVAQKIEIPSLAIACERILPHNEALMQMKNQKLKHPLTQLIREQVELRTEYLASLRLSVEAKLVSHKPLERIAAAHLQLWMRSYKENIFAPSIVTQSRMVKDLLSDRREHARIQEATALLYLDELLDEIAVVTAKIERNYLARLNDRDLYIVNGQSLRKAAYKDLRVLVVVLEASYNTCTSEEQREQIVALSSSLNAALQEFHTLLKMRNTKRKNKKETAAAVKELIGCELKKSKEKLDENNLPIVNYNDLKRKENVEFPRTYEAPASYSSLQTPMGSNPPPRPNIKGVENSQKPTMKNNSKDSPSTKTNKEKGKKKEGDAQLPPISGS